jgi:hypothetical protein
VDELHKLLRRLFDREEADVDAEWQLTEAAGLGMAAAGVRFIRPVQKNNRRLYEFEVLDGVVPPNGQLHLRKVDETGTEQVLRRRLRMLTTLSTQSELAHMLADPRGRLRTYQDDPLVEDDHFHNPAELKAVLSVLGMLSPAPKKPTEPSTLAVLSPYNEQAERLGRAIEDGLQSSLTNIAGFTPGNQRSGIRKHG